MHIAPHTLRVAAIFAVLSRLEEPKMSGLTLLKKLRLYDGEDVEGFRQKDVKQIRSRPNVRAWMAFRRVLLSTGFHR